MTAADEQDAVVVVEVAGIHAPDVSTLDALARLQLAAKRDGRRLRLRNSNRELQDLLTPAGLRDLIALSPHRCPGEPLRPGSPLRVGRESQQGEQVGVEEAGDRDDPPG